MDILKEKWDEILYSVKKEYEIIEIDVLSCNLDELQLVLIKEIEKINGEMPNKQLKMLLGWAAIHQEELEENWYLARKKQELFRVEPLK